MDWPIERGVVTVAVSSSGDASIYTTGTFGILGGIGHERVRKAALAFIETANKHRALASPTVDYSYPDSAHIRFFFVSRQGVQSVSLASSEANNEGSDAHDLFTRAQAVLTELRQITERQRGY